MSFYKGARTVALGTAVVVSAALGVSGHAMAQYNGSWVTDEAPAAKKPEPAVQPPQPAVNAAVPVDTWEVEQRPAKGAAKNATKATKAPEVAAPKIDTIKSVTTGSIGDDAGSSASTSKSKAGSAKSSVAANPPVAKDVEKAPVAKAKAAKSAAPKAAAKAVKDKSAAAVNAAASKEAVAPAKKAAAAAAATAAEAADKPNVLNSSSSDQEVSPSHENAPGKVTSVDEGVTAVEAPVTDPASIETSGVAPPQPPEQESNNAQGKVAQQEPKVAQDQNEASEAPPIQVHPSARGGTKAVQAAPGLFVVMPNSMPISGRMIPGQ